jgi:hypothetical protein
MLRSLLAGLFLASAVRVPAADSTSLTAIGLIKASGEFIIDGSGARDNSTVFQGSMVSTANAASHVVLEDGTRIDMGLDSRSRIYRDHVVIEKGLLHVKASNRYVVTAGRIRIDSPQQTLVRLSDSGKVSVTALQGIAEVKDGDGLLLAKVHPGRALDFNDADTASSDDVHVTGCLETIEARSTNRATAHYVLEDKTVNVAVELVGTGLERLVGFNVDATGSVDANTKAISPAAYVIRLRNVNSPSLQKCKGVLRPASQQAPPPLTGLSGATQAGLFGGIAAGATVGGLGVAGVVGGSATATTPSQASR